MVARIDSKLWFIISVLGALFFVSKPGRGIFRELGHAARDSANRTRAAGIIAAVMKLIEQGTSQPRHITVELDSGVVTLRGNIGAIEVRNLVEAIENLPGVVQVIDQLNVAEPKSRFTKRERFNE